MSGSRRLLWLIATLLLAALFAGLGRWQLDRGQLKQRMLEDFEAAVAASPQPIGRYLDQASLPLRADLFKDGEDAPLAYDGPSLPARVAARGRFDVAASVILDNQVLEGRPGAQVLTLFQPQSAARPVLVNLGWQALDRNRIAPPELPDGEVALRGLLVPPPSVGLRLGNAAWQPGAPPPLLAYLDIAALREQMGVDLFEGQLLLDADIEFGLVRHWQALPNTIPPERHRGYAVQWFGLALAVLATYLVLTRRRSRKRNHSQ
ncbi:MAG TPA: SURF1 family protein [Xanthomonadaceae bacterium]|nr:SURF1 family protein [Xanthomonadaceae bacterium]